MRFPQTQLLHSLSLKLSHLPSSSCLCQWTWIHRSPNIRYLWCGLSHRWPVITEKVIHTAHIQYSVCFQCVLIKLKHKCAVKHFFTREACHVTASDHPNLAARHVLSWPGSHWANLNCLYNMSRVSALLIPCNMIHLHWCCLPNQKWCPVSPRLETR